MSRAEACIVRARILDCENLEEIFAYLTDKLGHETAIAVEEELMLFSDFKRQLAEAVAFEEREEGWGMKEAMSALQCAATHHIKNCVSD